MGPQSALSARRQARTQSQGRRGARGWLPTPHPHHGKHLPTGSLVPWTLVPLPNPHAREMPLEVTVPGTHCFVTVSVEGLPSVCPQHRTPGTGADCGGRELGLGTSGGFSFWLMRGLQKVTTSLGLFPSP